MNTELPDWYAPLAVGVAIGAIVGQVVTMWYYGLI